MRLFLISLLSCLLTFTSKIDAHVGLDYPQGGETFLTGATVTITWTELVPHSTDNWDLYFSQNGGRDWETILLDIPYGQTAYNWLVPDMLTDQAMIYVVQDNPGQNYYDTSIAFTIETFLPVSLAHFAAHHESNQAVTLRWSTYWEDTHEYFEVERSQGHSAFEILAKIPGANHSHQLTHYEFEDKNPYPGNNIYRLKYIGSDGNETYSPQRTIEIFGATRWWPNPTSDFLYYHSQGEEDTSYRLYNSQGVFLNYISPMSTENRQVFDLRFLPPGIYYLQPVLQKSVHKFIKQ